MKLFTVGQIRNLDQKTILQEPISSIDLMERASKVFVESFIKQVFSDRPIVVFAGPGNNGGDALAIARMLLQQNYHVRVYLFNPKDKLSENCAINRSRLLCLVGDDYTELFNDLSLVRINEGDVIIDGLFGSGLNTPLTNLAADLIHLINASCQIVYSIDMPSGLFGENNTDNISDNIIRATKTFTFHSPKLSFVLPENNGYVGEWTVLDIQLDPDSVFETSSDYCLIEKKQIIAILHSRNKFAYKNNFGHALMVSGSKGKIGAAVLSAKAVLRAGAGLVTAHIPQRGEIVLQSAFPEAMLSLDDNEDFISQIHLHDSFSSVGIGPGIGISNNTKRALKEILHVIKVPLVLDADALNILAENKELIASLPPKCILTPHVGEFDRLTKKHLSSYGRLQTARKFVRQTNTILILKGAFSAICLPNGKVYFNSTGNPGMATAGSGDVLTGILTGLLSQSYSCEEAAILGAFIHGMAGDIARDTISEESLIATDILDNLGNAFRNIAFSYSASH